MFLKTIRQSRFEANVKVKLPSVVVRTSFEIFRALFDVRPRMRRLSQALQIEYDTIKHGELVCKHTLTVQITFLSEMDVKKVRYRRNWRDYLVSDTVSQVCNN